MSAHSPLADLTKPSYAAAWFLARQAGYAHMFAQGRTSPNADDNRVFRAEFGRLLWSVENDVGGFLGLDDEHYELRARAYGFTDDEAAAAFHAMGTWPVVAPEKAKAA